VKCDHCVDFATGAQAAKPQAVHAGMPMTLAKAPGCLYNRAPMGKAKKAKTPSSTVAQNRKARFDYHLEEHFEAGLALEGWEVKSLREGKANLSEAYILLRDGEAYLFGARIEPLPTASTHITPDPLRNRKLLLHRRELARIFSGVQKDGYTCVPVSLYWKRGLAKLDIALAKGKQKFDKRATERERDWNRQKQRLLRRN
tara:strand:+ start:1542 stop:2141 length:600 start_codon:yes stop_codon:yes gene_type:complete